MVWAHRLGTSILVWLYYSFKYVLKVLLHPLSIIQEYSGQPDCSGWQTDHCEENPVVNMSVFSVWRLQRCMYSIIWLTRSLIRPHRVCGGFFGPPATLPNLVLILGAWWSCLFWWGRAECAGMLCVGHRRTHAHTYSFAHTHTCTHI